MWLRFTLILLCLVLTVPTFAKRKQDTFVYLSGDSGHISGLRVAQQGDLLPIIATNIKFGNRPLILVKHPNRNFLYAVTTFDAEADGYSIDALGDNRIPRRETTEIVTFAIGRNGRLAVQQKLTVKGILGGLVAHPLGKWLYGIGWGDGKDSDRITSDPGGIVVFRITAKGTLVETKRTSALHTFELRERPGERNDWGLFFTPDGKYVYGFSEMGFMDSSSCYLQRFKVTHNGTFVEADALQSAEEDVRLPVGHITFIPQTKLAIVHGPYGIALFHLDKHDNLLLYTKKKTPDTTIGQGWLKDSPHSDSYVKAVDPKGRFFYSGEDFPNSTNVIYRMNGASAVPLHTFGRQGLIAAEPTGRFLYLASVDEEKTPFSTIIVSYGVSKKGRLNQLKNTITVPYRIRNFVFAVLQ